MWFLTLGHGEEIETIIDFDKISAIKKTENGTAILLDNRCEIETEVSIEELQKVAEERHRQKEK